MAPKGPLRDGSEPLIGRQLDAFVAVAGRELFPCCPTFDGLLQRRVGEKAIHFGC
jgi:hypothetical protein